jgi:hypothetical protein
VITDSASNSSQPWYFTALVNAVLAIMGETPASYAEVPFYLLANPIANPVGRAATSSACFWDENADEMAPDPGLQDEAIRAVIWDQLMGKMKTRL